MEPKRGKKKAAKRVKNTASAPNSPRPASSKKKDKGTETRKKAYEQLIYRNWCKSCGICIAFCPKGVLGADESGAPVVENPDACIGCRFCELHCPDFAITIKEKPESSPDPKGSE